MADSGAPRTDARFDRKDRTTLWLFLAALVVRIVYTLLRDVGNPLPVGSDANSYFAFAKTILSGTGWILHPGPELFRPPGYPVVLALLYTLTGGHLAIVQLLQSVVGAGSVALVYQLGRKHFGSRPALLAALWLLVNPLHLDYNGKLLRETWLVFLNVLLVASLLGKDGLKTRGVIRTALVYTILIHFDSRYVFHLPFFAVYFAIAAGENGRPAPLAAFRPVAAFVLFVLLFSAPWAIRNAMAYDRFVLIDTRALDRWGKRAQTAVEGDAVSGATALQAFERAKEARLDSLTSEERNAWRAGLRPRSGQPAKALFNFAEFWRILQWKPEYRPLPDGRFASAWSTEHNVSSFLFMGLLLPAFLLGSWHLVAAGNRAAILFFAFITVHTMLHVLVHSVVRYRLPVEPFCALIAFDEMLRWLPGTQKKKAIPAARPREPRVEVTA